MAWRYLGSWGRAGLAFGICTLATGCVDVEAQRQGRRATVVAGYRTELAGCQRWTVPSDYQQKVDGHLAVTLKDPDSRKVQFTSTKGCVACGQVNAKNSYGGYVGAQPFGALFLPDGSVRAFHIFDRLMYGEFIEHSSDEAVIALSCGIPLLD